MPRSPQTQQPSSTITTFGPTHDIAALWSDFSAQWAAWLARVGSSDPVYCLPEKAIERLRLPLRSGYTIFDAVDTQAERKLSEICRKVNSIGFWQDRPIVYPALSPRPADSALECLLQLYPRAARQECLALVAKADGFSSRLAGYAGCLRTEPAYLEEVQNLARLWNQLPPKERPAFPLCRVPTSPQVPKGAVRADVPTAQFVQELVAFLDRWSLMNLTTWDLPSPQGPLLPNVLPPNSPAMPTQGIHIFMPTYFPLQGDDDLHRHVLKQQQQKAKDQGLDASMAGLSHATAYERMHQVIHLEQTIVRRNARTNRPPPGFMTRVEEAIAAVLNCEVDNVKKLRKGISLCRRGKRESVPWLRPKVQ